jgi:hypothetical protein
MSCKPTRFLRSLTALSASGLFALVSCNFLSDLTKPFDYSTVMFRGWVRDATRLTPIENATVTFDNGGERTMTDRNGYFTFQNVRTGPHRLALFKNGFEPDTQHIDLTLVPRPDTFYLAAKNEAPAIVRCVALPDTLRSLEDTVSISFAAHDSTGGIARTVIQTGDGRAVEKVWPNAPMAVADSLKFSYPSFGEFEARLLVIGKNADTARKSVRITVPDNRRPLFSLIRLSQDGFNNGEWGFIEIFASDPDNNFHYLTINWGDTSKVEKSFDGAGAHWHTYHFTADTTVQAAIKLVDSAGAMRDTVIRIDIRNASAPILDDRIVYNPSQYLTPIDTVVMIGVKVLDIDSGYVSEIVWMINRDDSPPAAQIFRQSYNPQTGAIGVVGNVFAHQFQTAPLKTTNTVEIVVKDKYGRTSSVYGSLYKAGSLNAGEEH